MQNIFPCGQGSNFKTHKLLFFWRYLFFKMVVLNCNINLGGFQRLETTFEAFIITKMINVSKDDKTMTHSINNFPYIMILIFSTSSLEFLY